jgi:hypothetical protein
LLASSSYQLHRFSNTLTAVIADSYDCLYVPKANYITGDWAAGIHQFRYDNGNVTPYGKGDQDYES